MKKNKTDQEWRVKLDPLSYSVLREKHTEKPFSGNFNNHFEEGTYVCKGCGQELFDSKSKFDAGCGWPSFHTARGEEYVETELDMSHGMVRTEILCSNCRGHLGHVFNDGPSPTGQRYCVNSASLDFIEIDEGAVDIEVEENSLKA